MGWWLTYFTCQPCSLVSPAGVLVFPSKIPCWLTLPICLTSFWASFPSSSSPLSLIELPVACHCPFCPTCLCSALPTVTSFLSGPFQVLCSFCLFHTLKNGSFLFEHRCSECSQPQRATYSIAVSSLLLQLKIAVERESRPMKRWIISSSSEWVSSTGNAGSGLQLAAVTPHGLIVCCWERGSSSWSSGRFFR